MPEIVARYRWFRIEAQPREPRRKTIDYDVVNIASGETIGVVLWYCPWRHHVLEPAVDTVWSSGCLEDVAGFIASLSKIES